MSGNNPVSDGSPAKPKLEFITFTGTDVGKANDETRKRVRSHAQAHYRQISGRRRQRTIELDTSPLCDNTAEGASRMSQVSGVGQHISMATASGPSTLLDAGRTDPFATFGIGNSRRAHQLWDHGMLETSPFQRS